MPTQPATTPAPSQPAPDLSGLNPYLRILGHVDLRLTDGARLRLLVATPVITVEGHSVSGEAA